jgi:hypothetical protein
MNGKKQYIDSPEGMNPPGLDFMDIVAVWALIGLIVSLARLFIQ